MGLFDKWDQRNADVMRDHKNSRTVGSMDWYAGIFKDRWAKPILVAAIGIPLCLGLFYLILAVLTAL